MAEAMVAQIGAEEADQKIRKYIKSGITRSTPKEFRSKSVEEVLGDEDQPLEGNLESLYLLTDYLAATRDAKVKFDDVVWAKLVQYLAVFDPVAIRYAGLEWRALVQEVISIASKASQPHMAIVPVRTALLRLDPTGGTFTSLHLPFLRLCLEAGLLREALPIIDTTIYNFPSKQSHNLDGQYPCSAHRDSSGYLTISSNLTKEIHYREVHEYYLLSAMVYISMGRKRWPAAMLNLEYVLVTPSLGTVATGFQVEAYRKWLLLGVLLHGKSPEHPKLANSGTLRILSSVAKPYAALAKAFDQADLSKVRAEIDVGLQVWDEDGNLGLVLQLIPAHQRNFILKLQNTYASYPIPRLDTDPGRSLDLVTNLINNGDLKATIDTSGKEPVIRFLSSQDQDQSIASEKALQQQFIDQIARNEKLKEHVWLADKKTLLSNDYAQAYRKMKQDAETSLRVMEHGRAEGPSQLVEMVDQDPMLEEDEDLML